MKAMLVENFWRRMTFDESSVFQESVARVPQQRIVDDEARSRSVVVPDAVAQGAAQEHHQRHQPGEPGQRACLTWHVLVQVSQLRRKPRRTAVTHHAQCGRRKARHRVESSSPAPCAPRPSRKGMFSRRAPPLPATVRRMVRTIHDNRPQRETSHQTSRRG